MPTPMPPQYNPAETEEKIYKLWEESGFFNPDSLPAASGAPGAGSRKPFTIIMPPTNANGSLHAGHGLVLTIEDIMTRYKRMRGYRALWLPGLDHAGFETQVVYEKELEKEGRSRFGMERQKLYDEILEFTLHNKKNIEEQTKKMGASCDWSREKFTLDPDVVKTVYQTFKKLHDDGLVYRGRKIVNWCSKHQTSLSDLETVDVEKDDVLYYLKYGPFTIATARPETKFGDKYVVMHPNDTRYENYCDGQKIELEWINGPVTATIVKDPVIDMSFGTGAMTITPWHDAVDFDIAERHGLEKEQIIDFQGKLLPIAGEFAGMKITEARPLIVEKLKSKGLLVKTQENYKHVVKVCYKCGTLIEPQIKDQWFVKMKPLAAPAIAAIENGEITYIPEHYKKISLHWLNNIMDWNISRQIVWGIPIPAWFYKLEKPVHIKYFVHGTTTDNENGKSSGQYDVELSELGRRQNEELKKTVADQHFDVVFCSDLKRAQETAKAAFGGKTEIIEDKRLRECDYGNFTRKNEVEVSQIKNSCVHKTFPHGESYKQVEERLRSFLYDIAKRYQGKRIAIVSHQGPQLALEVILKGLSWNEAFENDWRNTKSYQPGWDYVFEQLVSIDEKKPEGGGWEKDPDTFDTWFSSGQWPFAALGYPDSRDYQTFYPTDVMETAGEIIFFWVARMIMLGLYVTGKVPFKTVYLHGLVLDARGKKMSKSRGNVIDPLELTKKYGTDAFRIGLVVGNTPGTSLALNEDRIRGHKYFANKIWNVSRFVLAHIGDPAATAGKLLTDADQKELAELAELRTDVTADMDEFRFYLAAEKIYHYVWHTFADEIIENSKHALKSEDQKVKQSAQRKLLEILTACLKLLHPFMPFITEEMYQKIFPGRFLMVEGW